MKTRVLAALALAAASARVCVLAGEVLEDERKWDLERGYALAARHSHAGGQIYDSRVFNHGAGWAPYSAATDPHCKKWVKQHRAAHPETAHTLAVQRERPLSSVPRSTLYHAQPQQLKKS